MYRPLFYSLMTLWAPENLPGNVTNVAGADAAGVASNTGLLAYQRMGDRVEGGNCEDLRDCHTCLVKNEKNSTSQHALLMKCKAACQWPRPTPTPAPSPSSLPAGWTATLAIVGVVGCIFIATLACRLRRGRKREQSFSEGGMVQSSVGMYSLYIEMMMYFQRQILPDRFECLSWIPHEF